MTMLLTIVVIIGFAGVIGNQYSLLRKIDQLNEIIKELRNEK
jgi:hypothetical protein